MPEKQSLSLCLIISDLILVKSTWESLIESVISITWETRSLWSFSIDYYSNLPTKNSIKGPYSSREWTRLSVNRIDTVDEHPRCDLASSLWDETEGSDETLGLFNWYRLQVRSLLQVGHSEFDYSRFDSYEIHMGKSDRVSSFDEFSSEKS